MDVNRDLLRFLILAALGITVTVGTGIVYGRYTQRWGPAPDMLAAAQHLKELPAEFGDWQLQSEEPIADDVLQILSCAGYVNRRYVNRQTGSIVSLAITVGPAGPISVHTPEICYSSRAYSIQEERKRMTLPEREQMDSFWRVVFRSTNESAEPLHVYYGWCANKTWSASESPRLEFAGRPLLYKLQLASGVASATNDGSQDACQSFLTDLLNSGWTIGG